jgi:acetate kinase
MNGVDLVIFTGGIGERDLNVRRKVLENMQFLGIDYDNEANQKAFGVFGVISGPNSKVKVMVVPTNEELEIAEQTVEVLKKNNK